MGPRGEHIHYTKPNREFSHEVHASVPKTVGSPTVLRMTCVSFAQQDLTQPATYPPDHVKVQVPGGSGPM